MSDEAVFSVTKSFHTIRGNDLADFRQNVEGLLGDGSFDRVATSFQDAFGVGVAAATAAVYASPIAEADRYPKAKIEALARSQAGLPPLPVPASPVAPALPQPGAPAAPPASLPGAPYPGDCAHGPRVYKDTVARGGPWRRWDCATPYSKEAQAAGQRCKAENV